MTTLHCPHVLNIIRDSMADFQSVTKFMVWSSRQVVLSDNETPLWFLALQYSGHLNNLFSIDKLNINIEKKQTYMLCLNYSAFKWPATSLFQVSQLFDSWSYQSTTLRQKLYWTYRWTDSRVDIWWPIVYEHIKRSSQHQQWSQIRV